ncbi:MAG: UvrD-helicase domain-containing protein, partial [Gammaproteobacteria bacterium]
MSMRPLDATAPETSASVIASAGTGKTWLLVTRMLRLLLSGAEPGGLLAVTFTNRAAGEVHARLMDRSLALAASGDAQLDAELHAIGVEPDAAVRTTARNLHERLLTAPWPPRVLTFHAFCQELLSRFPLEAGVAPGFELLATERELHDAAWEALLEECGRESEGAIAVALDRLATDAGSLAGARGRLRSFINHRADWWAWTSAAHDPLAHALDTLTTVTGYHGDDPAEWLTDIMRARIKRICALVGAAPTAAVEPLLAPVTELLAAADAPAENWCDALDALTLVDKGRKPRAQLVKKEIARTQGPEAAVEVERLQRELISASADWRLARLNRDWFVAGERLLSHYQRLKAEARVLDFADLEWTACRLLNATDHAPWIQYRLDQRVDHVLVDEFQDTNPTQWRMLQPLLAEIAAGDAGRARSAFVVGDPKQAIYGFRRADPRLLDAASTLLEERLGAPRVQLRGSRRSATAVLDCVNAVFGDGVLPLPDFVAHDTFLPDLPGRVEWLAVPDEPDAAAVEPSSALRNPLLVPRKPGEELRGLNEARVIAARIREMYDSRTPVADGAGVRPFGWADVMILVRQRTRLAALEQALRECAVPYASDSRGMLLERPEILDMLALLEFLVAPWNSLQLARLLKSPLFSCSDTDLLRLAPADPDAKRRTRWYPRLLALAEDPSTPGPLVRAADCLRRWREHADREPVHDLLDRIYADGNVLARYEAATPAHLRASVAANLVQFLDLALDADAGRYPTLHRLVERLEQTRAASAAEREFDDAPVVAAEGRVRVMTIHSAKGLEAPVVFVAQCDLAPRGDTLSVRVDWQPDEEQPRWLMLARNDGFDTATAEFRTRQAARAAVEDANLLYVALTRAR